MTLDNVRKNLATLGEARVNYNTTIEGAYSICFTGPDHGSVVMGDDAGMPVKFDTLSDAERVLISLGVISFRVWHYQAVS
jgi:hypothetical protein